MFTDASGLIQPAHPETEPPTWRVRWMAALPGALFALAGVVLLWATVLVPAMDDLAVARWQRDKALALEAHRQERLDRHRAWLGALDERQPALLRSLAVVQLRQTPAYASLVLAPGESLPESASPFPELEPGPAHLPAVRRTGSILERWTLDGRSRRWLVVAGGLLVLVGLLPASAPAAVGAGVRRPRAATDDLPYRHA